jgi:myo-inositol 2-dehydrogenase/D-chiro-inositol 1-dehydrogenase
MKAAAAGVAFTYVRPENIHGSSANSCLRLGIIGCGGRGTTVADAFVDATNTRVVALADLFDDQLGKAREHYTQKAKAKGQAGPDRLFRGPHAFRELANCQEVDVVLISSPDYFHPEHLDAVVQAGKHVYCEKPAAVDVAGCKRFMAIGEKVQGRFSMDVGFNVRHAAPFAEMVRRIHEGGIGRVCGGSAYYHATSIHYPPRPGASALEKRIRNFYWDRVLSGDIIVDQNIHVIDVTNWAVKAHPVKADGTGGRKVRNDEGNIWDHFNVVFTYPGDVHVSFNSIQYGEHFWDVGGRYFGDKGVAEAYYNGKAQLIGEHPWHWAADTAETSTNAEFSTRGSFDGLHDCDTVKVRSFVKSIISGKYHNEAKAGAISALSAILGRIAAYAGEEVTWDQMMASNQSYEGMIDLNLL